MISFEVHGTPVPQGSMKVINGHVIHAKGSALAAWRSQIAWAAREAGARPSIEPIDIDMVFTMLRPKTVTRPEPSVAPDLDKLVRGVLDALTAVMYRDDSQVTSLRAQKIYGERPGVWIQARPRVAMTSQN